MIIGNPMIFRHYSLDRAIRTMVDFGYEGVELWAPQIAGCKTDALRRQLAQYISALGLVATGMNAADADYFSALSSPNDAPAILAGLKRDIDVVNALGADYLLTWEGRRPLGATDSDVAGWILDTTVEIFRQAVAYAAEKNVRLFIEVHPYTLGIDLEFSCQLYDRVGSDMFGITYDCCHFGVGRPDDYIDAIYKLGRRIQHVHFSDSDQMSSELHFAPGAGCLNLAGIATALKETGFQGPVMLDLWLYPFPEEGSRQGVAYLREVLAGF